MFKQILQKCGLATSGHEPSSQDMIAAALGRASEAVLILDLDFKIKYANDAVAVCFFGASEMRADDLLGAPLARLFQQGQYERLIRQIESEMAENSHWLGHCMGYRVSSSHKEEFPIEVSVSGLGDGDGYLFVIKDYTETLEYVSLANKRLAAIEAAGEGIGLIDSAGNLTYMNRSMRELHGIDEDRTSDFINFNWRCLYNEKGRQNIDNVVMPEIEKYGEWRGESPVQRRNGEIIHAELSLTRLPDGSMVGTIRDITKHKKAQEEKEVLQQQMFNAQKMESIGRLAGGIAHDFNNILSAMLGYAEFLTEDLPESSEPHFNAEQITKGCLQAREIVEQILAFSRQKEVRKESANVHEIIQQNITMLNSTLPANISVDLEQLDAGVYVSANKTQLGQVFMNLFVNAIDAMRDKDENLKKSLKVSLDVLQVAENDVPVNHLVEKIEEDTGGQLPLTLVPYEGGQSFLYSGRLVQDTDYAVIEIEDDGSGMSADVLENIFEPFFSTKDVDKGTGLGLATVHGIVMAHNGAIRVHTKQGKGTAFTLYFPLERRLSVDKPLMSDQTKLEGYGRILLVDDEDMVRAVMAKMMARMGYEVTPFTNAEDAIDHLRENIGEYDIVVTDYTMPVMNGAQLAAALNIDMPDLPVLIVSGYAQKKINIHLEQLSNVVGVLRKPVDRFELSLHLHSAIIDRKQKEKVRLKILAG